MAANPQLLDYVRQQLGAGVTADNLKKSLLTQGWNEQDINEALALTTPNAVPTPQLVSPSPFSRFRNILIGLIGFMFVGLAGFAAYLYFLEKSAAPQFTFDSSTQSQPAPNTQTQQVQPVPAANTQQTTAVAALQCGGVNIPLPAKWSALENSKNTKLGADGCYRDENGCLCAKKDPNNPTKGVLFTVLVAYYPAGFTLDGLVANVHQPVSNKREFNLLGYPAVQFVATGASKIGTTAFTKDGKLYQFDFGAQENTFNDFWPDVSSAVQNITFQ